MVRAIRNGLWNASAHTVGYLAGTVGSVLIVRRLTPEAYGAFSYYIWLAGILGTLGTLAFPSALTKIASELRGNQRPSEAQALARAVALTLLGLNLLLSVGVLIWALRTSTAQRAYLFIVAAFLVPNALAAACRSTLWSREHYGPVSVTASAASLLQLVLIVVAFMAGWGAPGFVAVVLSTTLTQGLGLAWVLRRPVGEVNLPFSPRLPSRATLRRYLAFFAPASLALVFSIIIWQRSEVFFLERFSSLEQVGFYSLAYTVFEMLLALGWALVNGFYPAISRDYGAGEWGQIQKKVGQGVLLATLYAVPLSFGGWATLDKLIAMMYGPKMLPAVPVARVLFVGLLPGVLAAMFGLMVSAVGGVWLHVRVSIVLSILNIGLALILIPRLGALGGAISGTSSQFAHTVLLLMVMHRRYEIGLPWRTVGSVIGLGALTTLLLPEILQLWLPGAVGLVGTVAVAGCLYLTAIWSMGYLRPLRAMEATP